MGNCRGCGVYLKDENVICPICGFVPSMTPELARTPTPSILVPAVPEHGGAMVEPVKGELTLPGPADMDVRGPSALDVRDRGELTLPGPADMDVRGPSALEDPGTVPIQLAHASTTVPVEPMPLADPSGFAMSVGTDSSKEFHHLIGRGKECLEMAMAYRSTGNHTEARKNFQRAFRYLDDALKLNPDDRLAKQLSEMVVRRMV